jgi:hypothetical protein
MILSSLSPAVPLMPMTGNVQWDAENYSTNIIGNLEPPPLPVVRWLVFSNEFVHSPRDLRRQALADDQINPTLIWDHLKIGDKMEEVSR